jgi:hypothetical protein
MKPFFFAGVIPIAVSSALKDKLPPPVSESQGMAKSSCLGKLFRTVARLTIAGFFVGVVAIPSPATAAIVDTVYMSAMVRDFTPATNSDFQSSIAYSVWTATSMQSEGMVQNKISTNDKTSDFVQDNRGPQWAPNPSAPSEESFSTWYNDSTGVNRSFSIELLFLLDENGLLELAAGGSVTAQYEEAMPVAVQPAGSVAGPEKHGITIGRRAGQAVFTAQSGGDLSLFTIAGKRLLSVRLTAEQTFRAPAPTGLLLWQWRSSAGTATGRLF